MRLLSFYKVQRLNTRTGLRIGMNFQDLFESTQETKTVFQRKNGVLRALRIPINKLNGAIVEPKPMFPISKDRDEPTT